VSIEFDHSDAWLLLLRPVFPNAIKYEVCDQTIGNVLQRNALPPAPERKRTTTGPDFIRTHLALLAGTDFFTAEVLTLRGLMITYYVLFFIHLESRRVVIAGITVHPGEPWMHQMARNVTMEGCGALGQVGEGGVPVQGGSVRRAFVAAGAGRICRALPCRAQSPGEGQRPAVPPKCRPSPARACAVPRATGWAVAILPSGGGVNPPRQVSDRNLDGTRQGRRIVGGGDVC
jgi:hypothetical protein